MNEIKLQELINAGKQMKSRFLAFREKNKNSPEWTKVYNEQIYTIEILLDILREKPLNTTKLLTMAEFFLKYQNFKPPVLQAWCDKIQEYLTD